MKLKPVGQLLESLHPRHSSEGTLCYHGERNVEGKKIELRPGGIQPLLAHCLVSGSDDPDQLGKHDPQISLALRIVSYRVLVIIGPPCSVLK